MASKGVIFALTATDEFSVLVNFTGTGGPAPGQSPYGGLIFDGAGGYLGTAHAGGSHNHGVVFRVLPDGTYTVLAEFTGASGALPGTAIRAMLTRRMAREISTVLPRDSCTPRTSSG